eukprot:TRINITY_DN9692_c0_g2_i1.p1 TRINITY_DN9692_c0_g2~~TRINITY_DN9692_c0_g2_i1.p1  ORF type:complete len:195 (+),score=-11.69 TRINITY_DN9692_c0_g2_i1:168-752(+)
MFKKIISRYHPEHQLLVIVVNSRVKLKKQIPLNYSKLLHHAFKQYINYHNFQSQPTYLIILLLLIFHKNFVIVKFENRIIPNKKNCLDLKTCLFSSTTINKAQKYKKKTRKYDKFYCTNYLQPEFPTFCSNFLLAQKLKTQILIQKHCQNILIFVFFTMVQFNDSSRIQSIQLIFKKCIQNQLKEQIQRKRAEC